MSGDRRPIGIFDSGVGGLSVLREIQRELPREALIYAADTFHAPYGDKPAPFIEQRAFAMVDFLLQQGAKAIVVACNTATGVAVDALRARHRIPIVAIEPAVKPAAALTKSGVVGVLATSQTIASPRFARLVGNVAGGATVVAQACPGLVEQIELGALHTESTRALVAGYVAPLLERGADTLVLGCTHYPFVADVIQDVAGPGVQVIDPAAAVAKELRRRLESNGLLALDDGPSTLHFWTTGDVTAVRDTLTRLGVASVAVRKV